MLVFAGNAAPGLCPAGPAGAQHDHTNSGNYVLVHNQPAPPLAQDNWRHCSKCEALVFAGNPTPGLCPAGGQHDYSGSGNYAVVLQDHSEPIDQAIGRHLLTAFGPCNDANQARTTLEAACTTLVAKGGGVIVIPSSIPPDFLPRNAIQNAVNNTGVLIEDFRGGVMRFVVLPQGVNDIYSDLAGGMIVERDLVNDVHGQGGGSALSIANRSCGGVNSINDVLQQDVSPGNDVRFYVTSLRGLCPGNWVNIVNKAQQMTSGPIKALGTDGDTSYFVADTQFAYQKGDRFWNKNWFSAMEIADTHNADDQSGTVSIARTTYGSGDTFGIQTSLTYSGDIMSAGGDEGGVVYSADVRHDVDLFWGEVESWDPNTLELVYKPDANKAFNFWKIGTSRPIINMNPSKWIASGKIIVPQNGYNYNGIPSAIIGNTDVQWDESIIGQFITIDEPSEYWDPNSQGPDKDWAYLLGGRIVRRWFRIATLEKRADRLWNMGIETVWWGNYQGGKPALLHAKNYYTTAPNELRYIIAPGSWAIDVRHALGPRKYYVGATPQERTIKLAPFQQAKKAFAPGDPITQPAGPTPWTPTSYRTRSVNLFPPLLPGNCFVAGNLGPTIMGAGLIVDDGRPGRTLAQVQQQQKDGQPTFATGVTIAACTSHGIVITGPVLYAAMQLHQYDGNKKAIQWLGPNMGTSIYANPINGDFTIETSGNVNLALKSTVLQRGLSATSLAANNLRGFGVPVAGGTSSASIVFSTPEPDANYAILTECNWLTVKAVHNKSNSGFTVQFATAAPAAGGQLDWLLVR
jgi:hypothetical protein